MTCGTYMQRREDALYIFVSAENVLSLKRPFSRASQRLLRQLLRQQGALLWPPRRRGRRLLRDALEIRPWLTTGAHQGPAVVHGLLSFQGWSQSITLH